MDRTFLEESLEWLKGFGYEVHSFSTDYKSITFINYRYLESYYPTITCYIDENQNKYCELSDSSLKLFLSITTNGNLPFKHPNIDEYINVFRHYSKLCAENPPW